MTYEAFRAERLSAPSAGNVAFEDMSTAERAAAAARNAANFQRNKLRAAQANGYRTVEEHEDRFRFVHGGTGE